MALDRNTDKEVKRRIKAHANGPWIRFSERLPKGTCEILIASNYGVRTGTFDERWDNNIQDHRTGNDVGMVNMEGIPFEPTHWMPLPKHPNS